MASTILLSDNGVSSGSAGIKTTGGDDGTLVLQTTTAGGTATNALYINTSQNVGLGVAPSAWTSIDKEIEIGRVGNSIYGGGLNEIALTANTYYSSGWKYAANGYANRFDVGNGNGTFAWFTAASGSAGGTPSFTQAMTLDASGNLGVGSTSPARIIEAKGSGTAGTQLQVTGTTDSAGIKFVPVSGTAYEIQANTSSQLFVYDRTNSAYRMMIDSSGNFGLGVTPSAWSSGWKAIQLPNGTSIGAHPTVPLTYLNSNSYFNGTNNIYIASSYASRFIADGNSGGFAWQTAPSGTAGNAISFTQAMTLDASGRLGIGTTSPAQRLHVVGGQVQFNNGSDLYINSGASDVGFYSTGNIPMIFYTNSTERARIDSSGNLLVGATSLSSTERLKVTKAVASGYVAYFSNTNNGTAGDQVFRSFLGANADNSNSYHFVGTTGSNDKIYILGNGNIVNANNSYGGISDSKLKENVTDATPKLEQLSQVRVVNYNLIGDTTKQIGVVAQELEQVFPSMVDETPDYEQVTTTDEEGNVITERVATGTTTKSVKYSVFVPMLIKAIQEQQAIIESLKARLDAANL